MLIINKNNILYDKKMPLQVPEDKSILLGYFNF